MNKPHLQKTIISQYANSPIMNRIIQFADEYLETKDCFRQFYNIYWDIDTAEGVGLDFWGVVLGLSRFVEINDQTTCQGSSIASTELKDKVNPTSYRMNDAMYKSMLFVKAMTNIVYATAPNINKILQILFKERGRAYFVKSGTMTARYVFEFKLLDVEKAIVMTLLPRPTGVLCDFYEPEQLYTWGFNENELAPFGQAAFYIGDKN
ncbi:TPA: DUF2612 domain-containing protein [Mannheimia haemolytica]|nr:DUF2612 domain-containing protein [Mannheimia haemolytica]